MAHNAPEYFWRVKDKASKRWDQLERDPELAGPWRQMFKQIQSHKHVISELLQNADDVGATAAEVKIVDDMFVFRHNGRDFNEENLQSLCGFAYSNKRTLHTIGFRGIGFKSTFSLGPYVEVFTPSLCFAFHKDRFSEPLWCDRNGHLHDGMTEIRVKMSNSAVIEAMQQDIQGWAENPVPLLFFQNITHLSFGDEKIEKEIFMEGPVPDSVWVRLSTKSERNLLVIRSEAEEVPDDIIQEVRDERGDSEFILPPCSIELIYGLEQPQLFAVLSTKVNLNLSFSINAPFIQDPARTGIKDPIHSPMNRWLLSRAGKLAGKSFLGWLQNKGDSISNRALAYQLLPRFLEKNDRTSSGECDQIILRSFTDTTKNQPILLTTKGELANRYNCTDMPLDLYGVWSDDLLVELFGGVSKHLLAKEITATERRNLILWGFLEVKDQTTILSILSRVKPTNPGIEKTKRLWTYVQNHVYTSHYTYSLRKQLHIVPVQGFHELCSSEEVNVLGEKEKRLSDTEFKFLQDHLILMDPAWLTYIQQLENEEVNDIDQNGHAILSLFRDLSLNERIKNETVVRKASESIFSQNDPGENGIRIAHIAARLDVSVPERFMYLTVDEKWRTAEFGILLNDEILLESLLPDHIRKDHAISERYSNDLNKETKMSWVSWVRSEKSRVRKFLLPTQKRYSTNGLNNVKHFCISRGGHEPTEIKYKSPSFHYTDYYYDYFIKSHLENLSKNDPDVWVYLALQIASDWNREWEERSLARVQQETANYYYNISHGNLTAEWVEFLKTKPCIPDTNNTPCNPSQLLRNTPDTAALLRIERFVHPDFDKPHFAPLLDLLGVRSKPTDPAKIVDRIRALSHAKVSTSLQNEISILYDALDRVLRRLDTKKIEETAEVFRQESLILSQDLEWWKSGEIYRLNPDDIPGVPVVHTSAADLNLWDRLDVLKSPSIADALGWLNHISDSSKLDSNDKNRINAIIKRYPDKVWLECKHWLNLNDEWTPCTKLLWYMERAGQGLRYYPWVKDSTSDFSMLADPTQLIHIAGIPLLESQLVYQKSSILNSKRYSPNPEWIHSLAENLLRVKSVHQNHPKGKRELTDDSMKENAGRLKETRRILVDSLTVEPYLQGQAAAYALEKKVLWDGLSLFVVDDAGSKYQEVTAEITQVFLDERIREAVSVCVDRSTEFIQEYFETYFILEENVQAKDKEEPANTSYIAGDQWITPGGVSDDDVLTEGSEAYQDPVDTGTGSDETTLMPRKRRIRPEEVFAPFAQKLRFTWQPDKEYFTDARGHRILLGNSVFPWVEYDFMGSEILRYKLEEGSLEKGLVVKAEIVDLMKKYPETYCLVIHEGNIYRRLFWRDIDPMLHPNGISFSPAAYLIREIIHWEENM